MLAWIDWLAGWLVRLIGVGGLVWALLSLYWRVWDRILRTLKLHRLLIDFALERSKQRNKPRAPRTMPLPTDPGPDPRRPLD